jgi:hypothetical protein
LSRRSSRTSPSHSRPFSPKTDASRAALLE